MKRHTVEEADDPDEASSESNASIHYIIELKKIEEKTKHYTATVKINRRKKEFIIDTGSRIRIMPPDEELLKSTGIQKLTKDTRM